MVFRKTAATMQGQPVEFRHWKDVVEDYDFALQSAASSEEEEAVVDLWLEDPQSFMDEDVPARGGVRLARSGGVGLQRSGETQHKTAAATNWDDEFENARTHASSILKNLGNANRD
jgi:hypothetical protein